MTFVLVIRRTGIFASVNQKYHVALINWWRPMWRLTLTKGEELNGSDM